MEHRKYYQGLAERLFLFGMSSQDLSSIARYRLGKSFRDVNDAVREGRLEGLGEIKRTLSHFW